VEAASPVLEQTWQGWAQSRGRCDRREPVGEYSWYADAKIASSEKEPLAAGLPQFL
jgi:hypothetical protein